MSNPATVDDLLTLIERSGLLRPDQLVAHIGGEGEPGLIALIRRLVRARLLTAFQAENLLRGRHRGFFLTDKYKILSLLGSGGMGQVLLCEHLILRKLVAVKLLRLPKTAGPVGSEGSEAEARFLREARAAASLDDPHIVRVFDVDRAGANPFLVMEYVDGTNLDQFVSAHGALPVERAVVYTRMAAQALHRVFGTGLVHRDVKPANLMLDRSGVVKLTDLGLARFYEAGKDDRLTERLDQGGVVGTADFVAPEQALGAVKVDIRADVYALGCTLYFLLRGAPPFGEGTVAQKLLWHQVRSPTPVRDLCPWVPAELAAVLERMMQKDPARRYQTPAEVLAGLRPWAHIHIGPPTDAEMPRFYPDSFILGLSPSGPPVLSGPPHFSNAPNPLGEETIRPEQIASDTPADASSWFSPAPFAAHALPDREHPPEQQTAAPTEPPARRVKVAAPPPRALPRGLSLTRLLVVLAAVLLLAGAGLWGWRAFRPIPDEDEKNPFVLPPEVEPLPAGVAFRGGGSSFVDPLMQHWAGLYETEKKVVFRYKKSGSSAGVKGMTERSLDFACTDAPMTNPELMVARSVGGEVIHVPLALGAVVPTYNLPEIGKPLRFTGPLLADIYLGKVKRWNNPAIGVNNPGVTLPDLPITVVHRAEGSGTTYIWTDFLSKASSEWKRRCGKGTKVEWPLGLEGKGNDGVANKVSRTEGAIGYVELTYALGNRLPAGWVKNQEGVFVAPSLKSVTAAAAGALKSIPQDLRFSLTDAPGEDAYPIAGTVWAVLYVEQPAGRGTSLVRFLDWATHQGQGHMRELRYAPLPAALVERVEAKLKTIRVGS